MNFKNLQNNNNQSRMLQEYMSGGAQGNLNATWNTPFVAARNENMRGQQWEASANYQAQRNQHEEFGMGAGHMSRLTQDFQQNQGSFHRERQNQFNPSPMEAQQFYQEQYNPSSERGSNIFQEQRNRSSQRDLAGFQEQFNHNSEQDSAQFYQDRYGRGLEQGKRQRSSSPPMFSRNRHSPVRNFNQESPNRNFQQTTTLQSHNEASGGSWRPMVNQASPVRGQNAGLGNLTALGSPGNLNHFSNQRQLSRAGKKRYHHYLRQGFSHEEALYMAKSPTQPADNARLGQNASTSRRMTQVNIPNELAPMDSGLNQNMRDNSNQEFEEEYEPAFVSRKNTYEEYFNDAYSNLSEEMSSRSYYNKYSDSTHLEELRPRQNPNPEFANYTQRELEPPVDTNDLCVLLMPPAYPNVKLKHADKLDLEEAIIEEVSLTGSSAGSLRFTDIIFCSGYVEIYCANSSTADWLMSRGADLQTYKGCPVKTKLKTERTRLEDRCKMSTFMYQTAGKSDEFLLALLKSQNNYNTESWKIISRKEQENGSIVTISLDIASGEDILNNDRSIFYRYGQLKVTGLKKSLGLLQKRKSLQNETPRVTKSKSRNRNYSRKVATKVSAKELTKEVKNPNLPKKEEPIKVPSPTPSNSSIQCIDLRSDDEI